MSFSYIYSRPSWGARHRAGFGDRSDNYPLPECWTHHSVTVHLPENATVAQEKAQMRILEDIGQQRFGGGISYSFVIFPSGRVYMGIGASRIGAHTMNRNSVGLGVVFAGNYENHKPTRAAERAYARLMQDFRDSGVTQRARTNGGHRDAPGQSWNACPGNYLYARLGAINSLAAGSSVSTPATTTPKTPVLEGEVMDAAEVARAVWSDRGDDTVNKEATRRGWRFGKIHEYINDVRQRITSNAWADWIANRIAWRENPSTGVSTSAYLRRADPTENRYTSYVSGNKTNLANATLHAQHKATQGRNVARENNAMLKALASTLDELLNGQGKILRAVEDAGREAIQINAQDVVDDLEIVLVEDEEGNPDNEEDKN